MKAIILAAGVGSRIKPLTDNCPKILLKVGNKTILERMVSHIQDCGLNEIIFVVGYLKEQIKDYVKAKFPDLNVSFVTNDRYAETNTGYSLMLAKDLIQDSGFIKFDADIVFDREILKKLIECEHESCLCIDKDINLDAEEIKVIMDNKNRILKANKAVNPKDAVGESIGIEKISKERYDSETELLRSIPGVGPLTSLCFVLTLEEPGRIKRSRDVGAFLGLVPKRDQSGEVDKQLRITKAGDKYLRQLLVRLVTKWPLITSWVISVMTWQRCTVNASVMSDCKP